MGAPQGKDPEIVLFDWDELLRSPKRDNRKVKGVGSFVFKDGKYAIKMYGTSSTISLPLTSEGEEDAVGSNSLPEWSHPGSSLAIEEFYANMTNRSLGVAVRVGECDGEDTYYKIYGTKCNPLSLMVEVQDNNEGLKTLVKFQQFRKSTAVPMRYYGTFTFPEATLVPADAAEIDVTNGDGEYQLQDNAAPVTITGLANAEHAGVYTLIGSGGDNPAILEAVNAKLFLAQATDWQGLAGSRITLKAYEQAEGEFVFFEQSRSE